MLAIMAVFWAVSSVAALGVWYEREDGWDDDMILVPLWPGIVVVGVFCGAVYGMLWSLMWLGRGPVKLWRWHVSRRTNLPAARVHR